MMETEDDDQFVKVKLSEPVRPVALRPTGTGSTTYLW